MNTPVLLKIDNAVAHIILNRPDQANVLDETTSQRFVEVTNEVAQSCRQGAIRSVLLSAKGHHFCAGGDIREFATNSDLSVLLDRSIPHLHAAIHRLHTLPVPVISAVNGSIGGGGIGIALCADIVLGSHTMKLRGGYSAIGLSPDVGVSWFLTRLVGPMRAKQILFTNQVFTARQCLETGLVAELYDDDALLPAALKLAETLAHGASNSLARIKTLVDQAQTHTLHEHLEMEHLGMVACGASANAREGVQAFLTKRPPQFHKEA